SETRMAPEVFSRRHFVFATASRLIEYEHRQAVRPGSKHMRLAIEHEHFRRAGEIADFRMPQRPAIGRRNRFDATAVRHEQNATGGRGETHTAVGERMPPLHFARLVVDRVYERSIGRAAAVADTAQSHRAARIGLEQITDAQRIGFVYIEEPGFRRECGRWEV